MKGGQAASGVWMDCILCYAGDMKSAMRIILFQGAAAVAIRGSISVSS